MRKRRSARRESWMPFDSRIFPDILSFGHVKGPARLFLQVEMVISVLVVLGALVIVLMRVMF